MDKTVNKIAWYSLLTLIMVVIIGVGLYTKGDIQQPLGGEASPLVVDLIGTETGTSTAGVGFSITGSGGQSATTTYPYMIGNEADLAILTLKVKKASSTANFQFSFLGSNDEQCDTTATSSTDSAYSTYAGVVLADVNWFDIGDHLLNKVHSTSLAAGTSTLIWANPTETGGKELILSDLNYNCIALQVSGSSTVLWTQLETKKFR